MIIPFINFGWNLVLNSKLWKVLPGATQNISQIQPSVYDNKCVANCSHYKYRPGISSLKIDFNLYCGDKSNMKNWIHAPYWVGYIISNIFGGYLGDKTGRKPFCVLSLAVYTLASAATTLSPKTEVFLALRGITGMANGGCYTLGKISELKYRVFWNYFFSPIQFS